MEMEMEMEMEMREEERPRLSDVSPYEFAFVMDTLTESAKEQLYILEQRQTTFSNIKFFVEELKEKSYLTPDEFDAYISKWTPMLAKMRTLYEEGLAIGKAWDDLSTREPSHSIERSEIEKRAFEFDRQESQMSKDIESDMDLCPHQLKERMNEVMELIKMMMFIENDKNLRPHQLKEKMDEVVELIETMKFLTDHGVDPLVQVMGMVGKASELLKVFKVSSALSPSTTPMVPTYWPSFANATPDVFEKNIDGLTKLLKLEKTSIEGRVKTIAGFNSYVDELKRNGILEPHEFDAYFVKRKAWFEVSRSLNEEGAALGKAWDELKKRKPPAHRNPVERSAIEKRAIEYEKRLEQMVNDMQSDPDLINATITKRIDEAVENHKKTTKSRRRRGNA